MAASHGEAARTPNACQACRDKKVKCSGDHPCKYCSHRRLHCVFPNPQRRRLFAISQVRELQEKVASYERQRTESLETPTTHVPSLDSYQTATSPSAIAPGSCLSSSQTFGSEVATLISRANAGPTYQTPNDSRGPSAIGSIPGWPAEEDAHALLEVVIFNVGISQELFDARAFSDNLSHIHSGSKSGIELPELCIVGMYLVFAVGRLLQASSDASGNVPGTAFFSEAVKRIPALMDISKHGVLGVEVLALTALYLQIVDRKEEAYVYSSTAIRIAISHGLHRSVSGPNRRRPEYVRRNRLWWSLYMQERRLCAAGGYPMSIADYDIDTLLPYDVAGYPPTTALTVNVRTARVTGQITSTIYSQKDETEAVFVTNVQKILRSLHEIETTMPLEYLIEFTSTGPLIGGHAFANTSPKTARTSSGLYISVYSAVIHAVRPILLYMARQNLASDSGQGSFNPALRRLAEICVEAASKSLLILQALRQQDMIAKNTFLDLDALFSAGFIFVLVEAISPGKSLGLKGINGARSILRYLVSLGNRIAATRLDELDRMCGHLELPLPPVNDTGPEWLQHRFDLGDLIYQFSFETGYRRRDHDALAIGQTDAPLAPSAPETTQPAMDSMNFQTSDQDYLMLSSADLANIPLEGNDYLYGVYHASGMPLTGVEQIDWELLGNQG